MSKLYSTFISIVVLFCFAVAASAVQPTPEQLELLKSLPSELQKDLLDKIAKDNLSNNSAISEKTSNKQPVIPGRLSEDNILTTLTEDERALIQSLSPEVRDAVVSDILAKKKAQVGAESNDEKESDDECIESADDDDSCERDHELSLFGLDVFAGSPAGFAAGNSLPVPSNYTVGPDDVIEVQLFGKENEQYSLKINRDGRIQFPGIGPISVAGLDFQSLREDLHARISEQMLGVKASITLGELRSIQVYVLGEVNFPGAYTVSALSTITNALFVSGGLKESGSLRTIELKRNGDSVTTLDIYDLLMHGDSRSDSRLQAGDVVFVPPIGKTIIVTGDVTRPAIYEILEEKTAKQALKLAGGIKSSAYAHRAQIERKNGTELVIRDFSLKGSGADQTVIQNGDRLEVFPIVSEVTNGVVLQGNVKRPGIYQIGIESRITNLLSEPTDLLPNSDVRYVLVRREAKGSTAATFKSVRLDMAWRAPGSAHDLILKPKDTVHVFSTLDAEDKSSKEENEFESLLALEKEKRVDALLNQWQLLAEEQDAIVPLLEKNNEEILAENDKRDALQLTAKDFAVFAKPEYELKQQLANFSRTKQIEDWIIELHQQARLLDPAKVVRVFGAVRFPGEYPYESQMRVSDLLRASWDVVSGVDVNYALLVRFNPATSKSEFFGINLSAVVSDSNDSNDSSENILLAPGDTLFTFDRSDDRQFVVEPLLEAMTNASSSNNPVHHIVISGKVLNPGQYPYEHNMSFQDALNAAGGLTMDAYTAIAEISRYSVAGGERVQVDHIQVDLQALLSDTADQGNILRPFDTIQIKQIPAWSDRATVELKGEVRFPGSYVIKRGETLAEVISRAGGLTEFAAPQAAIFTRESLKEQEQEQLDKLSAQVKKDLSSILIQAGNSGEKNSNDLNFLQSLTRQLEDAEPVGRLVIDLPEILAGNTKKKVQLEDSDMLVIPTAPEAVTVVGEVHHPSSHLFTEELTFEDYLIRAGGATDRANKKRIYVVRANGSVVANTGTRWFSSSNTKIEPGDSIIVPLDVERGRSLAKWSAVTRILHDLSVSVAALNSVGVF